MEFRRSLVVLVLAALMPSLAAEHMGPEDQNAVHLNVLVWHPVPDEQGDPWGVPAININGTWVDWMAGYYGAFFYPTAVFDGVVVFERPPTGEGGGAYQETYSNYRRAAEERLRTASPVAIRIEAGLAGNQLATNVSIRPTGLFQEDGLFVRVVVFEDDAAYNGGNGIINHRFVVRDQRVHETLSLEGGEARFVDAFALPRDVQRERLGVVALVQNGDEDSAEFDHREILQAATWTARSGGATVQHAKGPLLELYSATWCDACVYGDSAADNLANEMGIVSAKALPTGFEYLRDVPWVALLVALAAGASSAFLMSRRRGGDGRAR